MAKLSSFLINSFPFAHISYVYFDCAGDFPLALGGADSSGLMKGFLCSSRLILKCLEGAICIKEEVVQVVSVHTGEFREALEALQLFCRFQ